MSAPKNHDQEKKAQMSHIPLDLLREFLCPAYAEGLEKYFENSWRLGFSSKVMMDALQRHLERWFYHGEEYDLEAYEKYGVWKHHLGAALFCLICMCDTVKNHPEMDDRVGLKDYQKVQKPIEESFGDLSITYD